MERSEIEARVRKVVARVLGVEENRVGPDSRFVEDLGAESVQGLELVASFEEEFGIEMEENAALEVKSVGKAVDFIAKYLIPE